MTDTGFHIRVLVGSTLLASAMSMATGAQARASEALRLGVEVSAPRGFVEFCKRDASNCSPGSTNAGDTGDGGLITAALDDAAPKAPTPDRARWELPTTDRVGVLGAQSPKKQLRLLKAVNAYVNRHVRQRSDLDVYGVSEYWNRSGVGRAASGDCEDIAIEKRGQLLERGFATSQLRFAVVYSSASGLHTVLVVATAEGDFVLDSRSAKLRRWNATPYKWLAAQDAERNWRSVDGQTTSG